MSDQPTTTAVPLALAIDPEAINRYVSEQIAKSVIGEHLKAAIEKKVDELDRSWNRTITDIVERHVHDALRNLVTVEYAPQIAETVKNKITEDLVNDLATKAFEKLARGY